MLNVAKLLSKKINKFYRLIYRDALLKTLCKIVIKINHFKYHDYYIMILQVYMYTNIFKLNKLN